MPETFHQRMKSRIAELERDAARYRWLRERAGFMIGSKSAKFWISFEGSVRKLEPGGPEVQNYYPLMDEAIDASRNANSG